MTRPTAKPSLLALGSTCVLALGGCALVSRGDTLQMRYFTLEPPAENPSVAAAPVITPKQEHELRLGRIDATGGLEQQLAVRTGANELTYREEDRWTERPAQYVRRGLERALFQEHGLTRAYSGNAPTLDVELVELEVQLGGSPKARVRLLSHLHDQRRGLCDATHAIEQPIKTRPEAPDQAMPESVAALSRALHQTIQHIAEGAVECLNAHAERAATARSQSVSPASAASSASAETTATR